MQFLKLTEEAKASGRDDVLTWQYRRRCAYQTKLETARKFIAHGDSPEEIADVSGFGIDQVQSLMVGLEQL